MLCPSCHRDADAAADYCDFCGNSLLRAVPAPTGASESVVDSPVPPASPAGTVPLVDRAMLPGTPIVLGAGEVIWRQYAVCQLRTREQGDGMLFVTDARVVFFARARGRGTQRASALVQQTRLGDVTGLTAFVSRRISMGWMLVTILLALNLWGALQAADLKYVFVSAGLLALAVLMLLRGAARRGSVGVQIHSGATQQSPIAFGQFEEQRGMIGQLVHNLFGPLLALFGVHTAFDVLVGFPGQDAERVISELGALIFDLQSRGGLASTHWGLDAVPYGAAPARPATAP